MASTFVPRTSFPAVESIPRSYYLGHHRASLSRIKTLLPRVDLVMECRDYRLPLTSRHPLFEETLAGSQRMIVYTKKDLGSQRQETDRRREQIIRQWHAPTEVVFCDQRNREDIKRISKLAHHHARSPVSLTGSKMLVVGMPNVGKSSLLNALRRYGVGKGKVARTGAQPGVTRKIATSVKIAEGGDGWEGLYVVDTPGVFMAYVPNVEAMLKLALCGTVKDTVIPLVILADYLLYHLNLFSPSIYSNYHQPTNDILLLLDAVARKTGRLQKGGTPDMEGTALWLIQRWRTGHLGQFVLDEVSEEAYARYEQEAKSLSMSLNQAKKADKEARKTRRVI